MERSHLAAQAIEQERQCGVMLWLRPEYCSAGRSIQRSCVREYTSQLQLSRVVPLWCDLTNDLLQVRADDTRGVCVSWCLTLGAYIITNVVMNIPK